MTDVKGLSEEIAKSGLKISYIADALGLSREGLYKKLNNETEFKASEIMKMKEVLGLSNERRDDIFFANEVERKSTIKDSLFETAQAEEGA